MTNEPMLTRGLELLKMLKEDLAFLGADSLHQLQRSWELHHRVIASECVTHHTMYRKETRWPGYYYRGDHRNLMIKTGIASLYLATIRRPTNILWRAHQCIIL